MTPALPLAWLYGSPEFLGDEEHKEFQYRLLIWILWGGALITALVILGALAGLNPLHPHHLVFMGGFAGLSLCVWRLLRGRPDRLLPLAWVYQGLALAEYIASWVWASHDELRAIWFLVNVPGVYIVLGARAGAGLTAASVLLLWFGNGHTPQPQSANAMATLSAAMVYLAVFFHFYVAQVQGYYARMRASAEQLKDLASHDHLTGVLNARAFQREADRWMAIARRHGRPCSLLFVDLDHFKRVNDEYGHASGDLVLRSTAQALQADLRQSDVLGRVGGEEFVVLLPETEGSDAMSVANAIRAKVEALCPEVTSGRRLPVTASIGVATSKRGECDLAQLQRLADAAMYQAKATGRNRVCEARVEEGQLE